jgi:hypothetical protein
VWADCELCSDPGLTTFLESWSGGELDIASCRYGQLEIAILHGDLEQIANWVEPPGVQVNVYGAKAEISSWTKKNSSKVSENECDEGIGTEISLKEIPKIRKWSPEMSNKVNI